MNWRAEWWEIGLVPVVIAAILALMFVVRLAAKRAELSPETQRKIIHVAVGISSLFFPLIFSGPLPVLILIAAAILVMLWLRRARPDGSGLGDVLHAVRRPSYGEIYLALSVAFLFLHSQGTPVLYVLPLLVVTLSDTASALVGTSYGRHRFPVQDGAKSMEGVVAFFTVTWICAMIVLLLMSDTARLNVIVLSFLIAGFCALVEADSWRGLDNLFIPVGAHLLLARHLGTEPVSLALLAIVFVAAVFVAIRFSAFFGITKHAARSYTIMLFLLLSVTSPLNAILPVMVIVMHVLARQNRPCRSGSPDLDLLAAAIGVSLLWMFGGQAIGQTVINLFNLTFAGVAVIFAGLAASANRIWRYATVPFALVVGFACAVITEVNPAQSQWYDPAWPPILLGIGFCLLAVLAAPHWFDRWRAPKAFGIAMVVPFILFLADGVLS